MSLQRSQRIARAVADSIPCRHKKFIDETACRNAIYGMRLRGVVRAGTRLTVDYCRQCSRYKIKYSGR